MSGPFDMAKVLRKKDWQTMERKISKSQSLESFLLPRLLRKKKLFELVRNFDFSGGSLDGLLRLGDEQTTLLRIKSF